MSEQHGSVPLLQSGNGCKVIWCAGQTGLRKEGAEAMVQDIPHGRASWRRVHNLTRQYEVPDVDWYPIVAHMQFVPRLSKSGTPSAK
jgi:hypothetical protein